MVGGILLFVELVVGGVVVVRCNKDVCSIVVRVNRIHIVMK
jgi:hypothetical protein